MLEVLFNDLFSTITTWILHNKVNNHQTIREKMQNDRLLNTVESYDKNTIQVNFLNTTSSFTAGIWMSLFYMILLNIFTEMKSISQLSAIGNISTALVCLMLILFCIIQIIYSKDDINIVFSEKTEFYTSFYEASKSMGIFV